MPKPMLLEGHSDPIDPLIHDMEQLAEENQKLRQANAAYVEQMRRQADTVQHSIRAVRSLRTQLAPLYEALKSIFGDLDSMSSAEPATANASTNPKWDSWKKRMPGRPAEFIDLLLVHESMTVKQFMAAMHCGKDAVYQVASKLIRAGLVVNNNGHYSLKS